MDAACFSTHLQAALCMGSVSLECQRRASEKKLLLDVGSKYSSPKKTGSPSSILSSQSGNLLWP